MAGGYWIELQIVERDRGGFEETTWVRKGNWRVEREVIGYEAFGGWRWCCSRENQGDEQWTWSKIGRNGEHGEFDSTRDFGHPFSDKAGTEALSRSGLYLLIIYV